MSRLTTLTPVCLLLCVSLAFSQEKKKVTPDINESKEFPNVFHSPSADSTPKVFRSVLQMEVVVKRGEADPKVQYVNGTVVSRDGLIATVLDEPGTNQNESGGILSASILMLDGGGAPAELVSYEPAFGVAIFRVPGLGVPALALSKSPLVADRRVNWHAVFKNGRKTYLYSRPLRVHKASHQIGKTDDLCEMIDPGTSSLNADRTGSALVAQDGTLIGLMGWQKHWNVTPKSAQPRKKLAWAVPAHVIAELLENTEN